ncbi:hypothetical protein BGZ83_002042 [Gryganskiella cystojenkinii]|nr:hypothetical protein BGZ83_002042 [Gryganskiella cystojenkinii]
MKTILIGLTTLLAILSVISSSKEHKVTVIRVVRSDDSDSTRHHLEKTLARYSNENPEARAFSRLEREQMKHLFPHQKQIYRGKTAHTNKKAKARSPQRKQRLEQQRRQQQEQGGRQEQQQMFRIDMNELDKYDLLNKENQDAFEKQKVEDGFEVESTAQGVDPLGSTRPSSRRSKQIDSRRVPIDRNPSEVAFVGQVGIGTPPQYFSLEFDIGSADTWVTSAHANCSLNSPCTDHRRRSFFPDRSTTYGSDPNITWGVDFSDGAKIEGRLESDVVQVAGFVINRQVIGVVNNMKDLKQNEIDGSLGLGLTELTYNGDATPIENLISAGSMRSEVGIWLGNGVQGGELVFGGRDHARYLGELSYFNVPAGSAYWSIPVKSVTVITQEIPTNGSSTVPKVKTEQINSRIGTSTGASLPSVIFDTSSNLILVPPRVALEVHRQIHNFFFGWYSGYSYIYGAYTVSCSLVDDVGGGPDLWVELGPAIERATGKLVADAEISGSAKKKKKNQDKDEDRDNEWDTKNAVDTSTKKEKKDKSEKDKDGDEEMYEDNRRSLLPSAIPFTPPRRFSTRPPPGNGSTTNLNNRFRISGRDLVRERVPVMGTLFNICYSGVQASKTDEDDWVFGNIWFMSNYMTLDHQHRQVGIAPAVQPEL